MAETPPAAIRPRKLDLAVAVSNRAEVVNFYQTVYKASRDVASAWNGNVGSCLPGTTSQAYIDATVLRLNYFRAMAGLPGDVMADPAWNDKAQQAALMMSAQGQLSHSPITTWACYSVAGAEAAGKSNLSLGADAASAIDLYLDDPGSGNAAVGHRRWILNPPGKVVGVGNIPAGITRAANALWVIGGVGARPPKPEWVAWPPPGCVPWQVMPKSSGRWSFSYAYAVFTNSIISMSAFGTNISVAVEPLSQGYADNTIVWRPSGMSFVPPSADTTYSVTVSNVIVNGKSRSFAYAVTVIDAERPALAATRSGTAEIEISWSVTGASYRLFSSPSLPGSSWTLWAQTPPAVSGRHTVRISPSNSARFFRLEP